METEENQSVETFAAECGAETALNMLRCAQTNLANLGNLVPAIRTHSMYLITEMQIQDVVLQLEEVAGYNRPIPATV